MVEGLLGLAIVALLISFLPTIYGHFSRREVAVAKLASRAGTPPTPAEMIIRAARIGGLERLDEMWPEWEDWFIELEESHTSYPALVFFRSPADEQSWVLAAGASLDGAAMRAAVLDMDRNPDAELCIRAGFLALRAVADFFGIDERSWVLAAGASLDAAAIRASTLDLDRNPDAELCIRAGYLALRAIADFFGIDMTAIPSRTRPYRSIGPSSTACTSHCGRRTSRCGPTGTRRGGTGPGGG